MKHTLIALLGFVILAGMVTSCGKSGGNGQLTGVKDRPKFSGINPYGMSYIPSGTAHIGQSDQDIFNTYTQRPKAVSIIGFYIDETEITNNEYREFVYWVRDSIAHEIMGDIEEDDFGNEKILWDYDINWNDEILDEMYYEGDMAMSGKRELNVDKMNYTYQWVDWKRAASRSYKGTRKDLIRKKEVGIFPDTLVWIRDFSYSYNEPYARNYFWHPAFDDYPIVGVDWHQANAFCDWRTKMWNLNKGKKEVTTEVFRLPTETEWEYASRGGHDLAPYPWGSYYVRNAKGCLLANFKPGRGNYPEDGGMITVKADAYFPNDYGLYNMAGNVAEWTSTAYYPQAYGHVHDMNPDLKYDAKEDDPKALKRKVIRGGSWKDISYFLQTGTRHWEYQDTAKSYVGFRCALTFLGRAEGDFR